MTVVVKNLGANVGTQPLDIYHIGATMGRPYSLLNQYRIYDEAFMKFLTEFKVDYGKISGEDKNDHPILSIMSPPERAFAKIRQILVRKGWVKGVTEEEMRENAELHKLVPLPFLSVQRKDVTQDFDRSKAPIYFNNFERYEDGTTVSHPYPVPVDFMYDVTMWCKYQYTAVFFQEWLNARVGDRGASPSEFFIYVDLGPFGRQLHGVKVDMIMETSNNANLLYGFRDFMYMASFTMKGWVFKNPYDEGRKDVVLQQENEYKQVMPSLRPPDRTIHVSSSTDNLIKLLSRYFRFESIFETKDASVEFSPECSDGRYDVYSPYTSGLRAYKMTFDAVGGTIKTRLMPTLPKDTVMAFRYVVKREAGSAVINVRDREEKIVRQLIVNEQDGWQDYNEIFFKVDKAFRVEFVADADELLLDKLALYIREGHVGVTEYVVDADMTAVGVGAWTALGGAALSKVVVGGRQRLRVDTVGVGDGVQQDITVDKIGVYVLSVDVYSSDVEYMLTFTNGAVSDTAVIKPDVDKRLCLVVYSSENFSVKIEQIGGNGNIILDDISIKTFFTCPMVTK